MALIVIGFNHTTDPIEIRELLAFEHSKIEEIFSKLFSEIDGVSESSFLTTCNRTELYLVMYPTGEDEIRKWWAKYRKIELSVLNNHLYCFKDFHAVRHITRVAAGLDSMVLGETQIMRQLKDSIQQSRSRGFFGPRLENTFNHVLSTAKKVRSNTGIGKHSVSVASTAVKLAGRIFSKVNENRVLLVGAGETIELVAEHFITLGVRYFTVANRSLKNAQLLASKINGRAVRFNDLVEVLYESDVIVSATASEVPIIRKSFIECAMQARRHKPMLLVDLAVPRDIEFEAGLIEGVFLYSIDDLDVLVDESWMERRSAAAEAELLIEDSLTKFKSQMKVVEARTIISALHKKVEEVANTESDKTLRQIKSGGCVDRNVKKLAYQLAKKILHRPTMKLREAAEKEDTEKMELIKQLFDIDRSDE